MRKKYYDEWEFKKILTLMNVNPYESRFKFEKYLENYPKDYSAWNVYGYNLIMIGELEESKKTFEYVETSINQDKQYQGNATGIKDLKNNLLQNKLRLLCYEERFEEAYNLLYYRRNKRDDNFNFSFLEFFCEFKLGLHNISQLPKLSYLREQLMDYSEERLFEHIKKHLSDYCDDQEETSRAVFK